MFDKRYNWGQTQLVRVGIWGAATPATLSLESVDGAPIRFDVKSAVEGNKAWALFGGMKHATDTITTSGTGAFQLEGDAKFGPVFKSDTDGIASWSIAFAEHPGVERDVCLDNGYLATIPEATVLYIR